MSEHEQPFGASRESVEAGHQPDLINMGAILMFGLVLIAVCVATFGILAFVMGVFESMDQSRADAVSPVFDSNEGLYPAPRLQARPPVDMAAYNEVMAQRANSYGWIDRKADIAHIPIDRAIDVSLQKADLFRSRRDTVLERLAPRGDSSPPASPSVEPAPTTDSAPEAKPAPASPGESPK